MPKISIVKGENRKENIIRAIELLKKEIEKTIKIKKTKQLFIKINAIDTNFPLACTNTEALVGVLDIFYGKFDEIIVGDNSFVFTKYNGGPYRQILRKFPKVKLSDLTEFGAENIKFKLLNGKISTGKISSIIKNSFSISLALPKTHDTFVYTGCLKNMFGCVIKNRGDLHAMNIYERLFLNKYVKSNKLKWDNLIKVIRRLKPDLSILDSYEGMEGNGPLFGSAIKLGTAICSLDGVALDKLSSEICGLAPVPYIERLQGKENNKIEIIKEGFNNLNEITKKFKPHYNNEYQKMTSLNSLTLPIDIKMALSILKRSYRLKDKIIDKLREKI